MARKKQMGDLGGTLSTVLTIAVVAGVAYIGYNVYKNGFSWLFGTPGPPGSPGTGTVPSNTPLAQALNPGSSSAPTQQATIVTDAQITTFYNSQPPATNPFQVSLYTNNPGSATITQAQATTLWAGVLTAGKGTGFLSLFKDQPDMSPVLQEFQIIAQNGVDISFVSTVCMAAMGVDLGTYMFQEFGNDQAGTSGVTNMQLLANFVYWAFALPTD
jgi:hypothetical protein